MTDTDRAVTIRLTDQEHAHLAAWMGRLARKGEDDTDVAVARKLITALDEPEPTELHQISVELAARQRDLVNVYELATSGPRDGLQALRLLDDIADAADPDGWADGTAELAWEAQAEAPPSRFREDTP